MKTYAVETAGLTKRFRSIPAVDAIDLKIPQGEIFGLVGENGAGKSTLMKLLAGMMQPSEGSFRLFGKEGKEDAFLYHRVGALIEQPGLIPSLTAMENMKTKALAMGLHDERELQRLLALCDIDKSGRKKVRAFSLGMKQRLGIAMALLGSPRLLILDEPTNGLDPAGIQEMRALIHDMPDACGATVLISSHLLGEMEQIVSQVGIINHGQLLFEGPLAELQRHSRGNVVLRLLAPDRGAAVLRRYGLTPQPADNGCLLPTMEDARLAALVQDLAAEGAGVVGVERQTKNLEEIFLSLTNTQTGKEVG